MTLALLIVLMEAVIIAVLLKFVRTFGQYTHTLLATHQTNLLIQQENLNLRDELRTLREKSA